MRPNCKARQYSDQMTCDKCQLQWDTNDPDPPPCKTGRDTTFGERCIDKVRSQLKKYDHGQKNACKD